MNATLTLPPTPGMNQCQRTYALALAAFQIAEEAYQAELTAGPDNGHPLPHQGMTDAETDAYIAWTCDINVRHKLERYRTLLRASEVVLVEWFREVMTLHGGHRPELDLVWKNWETNWTIREKLVSMAFKMQSNS